MRSASPSSPSPLPTAITAGLFASLASHIGSARWRYPRLIAQLRASASSTARAAPKPAALATGATAEATEVAAKQATREAKEGWWSLGSSGAVYAMFAVTAFGFPDAEVTFVIPPWFPINIQTGFYAFVALDVLGVIRGWK